MKGPALIKSGSHGARLHVLLHVGEHLPQSVQILQVEILWWDQWSLQGKNYFTNDIFVQSSAYGLILWKQLSKVCPFK